MYSCGASLFFTFVFLGLMILFIPVIINELKKTSDIDGDSKYDSPFRLGLILPVLAFAVAFCMFIGAIPRSSSLVLQDGTKIEFAPREYRIDESEYNRAKIFKGEKDDVTYKVEFSNTDIPKTDNLVEYILKQDKDVYALKYNGQTYVVLGEKVEIK